ncbi:hypothetical protein P154DRAFT_574815 [Amniculicola lignicola CBS 123094]|uniref:Uncharacterized protein n=1 Tax=Amniculicola lignicola CBS 123094 TaxID=1392246 RepID=A0A6A5WJF4_9PLEO|nr:hypothetical protein P154DRAFT_574815 [Amniculicola lignicola CBS 123094]
MVQLVTNAATPESDPEAASTGCCEAQLSRKKPTSRLTGLGVDDAYSETQMHGRMGGLSIAPLLWVDDRLTGVVSSSTRLFLAQSLYFDASVEDTPLQWWGGQERGRRRVKHDRTAGWTLDRHAQEGLHERMCLVSTRPARRRASARRLLAGKEVREQDVVLSEACEVTSAKATPRRDRREFPSPPYTQPQQTLLPDVVSIGQSVGLVLSPYSWRALAMVEVHEADCRCAFPGCFSTRRSYSTNSFFWTVTLRPIAIT